MPVWEIYSDNSVLRFLHFPRQFSNVLAYKHTVHPVPEPGPAVVHGARVLSRAFGEPQHTRAGEIRSVNCLYDMEQSDISCRHGESKPSGWTFHGIEQAFVRQILEDLRHEVVWNAEPLRQLLYGSHLTLRLQSEVEDRLKSVFTLSAKDETHGSIRIL